MKPETLRYLEMLRHHLHTDRIRYAVRFAWGKTEGTGTSDSWDAFTRA